MREKQSSQNRDSPNYVGQIHEPWISWDVALLLALVSASGMPYHDCSAG